MVKTFPFHYLTYDRNGQVYATARKICKQAVGSHRSLLVTQVGLPLISVPPRHCLEAKSTHSLSSVLYPVSCDPSYATAGFWSRA